MSNGCPWSECLSEVLCPSLMVFFIQLLTSASQNTICLALPLLPQLGKKALEDMDFSGYWEDGEQVLSILRKLRAVSIRIILGLACLLFGGW